MTGEECEITVLRLGHRLGRDPRISTHLALTARAYGADQFLLAGDEDDSVLQGVSDVVERWGGEFSANHEPSPLGFLRNFTEQGGTAIHLTMYGQPYHEVIPNLPTSGALAIVVGGAKVGREYYEICEHNVAVGNQPHSEVAALAGFLEVYLGGAAEQRKFAGAQVEVNPHERGKDVIDHSEG